MCVCVGGGGGCCCLFVFCIPRTWGVLWFLFCLFVCFCVFCSFVFVVVVFCLGFFFASFFRATQPMPYDAPGLTEFGNPSLRMFAPRIYIKKKSWGLLAADHTSPYVNPALYPTLVATQHINYTSTAERQLM